MTEEERSNVVRILVPVSFPRVIDASQAMDAEAPTSGLYHRQEGAT